MFMVYQCNIGAQDPANPLLVEDQLWDVRWDNTYITSMYDNATGRRDGNTYASNIITIVPRLHLTIRI